MNKYRTDNMAVAAYLDINGLKYIGYAVGEGRNRKPIVIFEFDDDRGVAQDLERAFRNSNEKKYRDSTMFFRNEVYKAMEGSKN